MLWNVNNVLKWFLNLGALFLVVMASTILFELSQISCEIYINTFTSVYDILL